MSKDEWGKVKVYEQSESNNRAAYAKEEISTYKRPQNQYFKSGKLKKEYKTLREYSERSITHNGVWLDIDCLKNRDKIITTWVKSMNIALTFHNLDRYNNIEFLKTLTIVIVP